MGKRTDRLFHITITAFAMTLTAVSAVTMVYQRDPGLVRLWLRDITNNSLLQSANRSPQEVPSITTGPYSKPQISANSTGISPIIPTGANTNSVLTVQSVASDLPAAKLTQVRQLITQYRMMDTVAETLNMSPQQTVHIYLAQTNADYQTELARLGLSLAQAQSLSKDTGGFTEGDTIIVPISQNKSLPDLVNTLGHEITHVFLNHYVSDVPSWMNEGLAVHDGMKLQSLSESQVQYSGYAKRMSESILAAASNGSLIPLTGNEQQVLQGGNSYDLELQDWLAVNWLIQNDGLTAIHNYLQLLKAGVDSNQAFNDAFGITETTFNTNFTSLLKSAAAVSAGGVDLQFSIPASFHGYLQVLQHGSQNWQGFQVKSGLLNLTVTPGGSIKGVNKVQSTPDANPPDNTTLYINLQSTGNLTYQGQPVQDCGFAIDYHNGLYSFINNWITPMHGQTVFSRTPSLFGVTLNSITEHNSTDPILSLIQ